MSTIPDAVVSTTCKFGQGQKTCRYLLLSGLGFNCAKMNPDMKSMLDNRVAAGSMHAHGDNCSGWNPALIQIGQPSGTS